MGQQRRVILVVLAVLLALAGAATGKPGSFAVAYAQEEPPPETSTTTTEPPDTTTTTAPPDTTTTSIPDSTTSTTEPETTTSTSIPETTTTTIPVDGDPGEAPSDPVPITDVVVPPQEGPLPAFADTNGSVVVLKGQLDAALAISTQAEVAHQQTLAWTMSLMAKIADIERQAGELQAAQRDRLNELASAQVELNARAANAYIRGNISAGEISTALSAKTATDFRSRKVIIEALAASDLEVVERFLSARKQVRGGLVKMASELASLRTALDAAITSEQQALRLVLEAQAQVQAVKAGSEIAITGFVFPVGTPYNFSSTYGAPRMPGSTYAHSHQGNDIFAPHGTNLYAVERGVIAKVGTDVLGGTKLWIKGQSGTYYYYAHLSGFAPGVADGVLVEAGTVVGYVGNTGNAISTPPHLHFEIHPNGGAAIDPYPLLRAVADLKLPPPTVAPLSSTPATVQTTTSTTVKKGD